MSYLALYRKYRPTSFDDFVGQSETSSIIKNEILNNKISHAYLFSGPRGTGKTSTAKIIARMINCSNLDSNGIPCGQCVSCLNFNSNSDIVEIDAASNNGVDEIRELRDKVNLVPTFGKYKIYIIDEVHMLTTQAFNALLKTLEEPPSHVIFILATTEFHKIPITVVSRCQKFQFLKFSNEEIASRLSKIANMESINVSDEILLEISRLSDGGLRDAINMLDQLSSLGLEVLSIDDVYRLNGVVSYDDYVSLLKCIYKNDLLSINDFFDNLDRNGKSIDRFINDFIVFLKDVLFYINAGAFSSNILKKNESIREISDIFSSGDVYNLIILLNDLSLKIKNSSFSKILIVVELIRFSSIFSKNNLADNNDKAIKTKEKNIKETPELSKKDTCPKFVINDKIKKIRINNAFATASKNFKDDFRDKWSLVLDKLSNDDSYLNIAGMMTDVEILVVGKNNVMFLAKYDSLLERLNSQILLIEKLLFSVFDVNYKVVFLLKDEWDYERNRYVENLKKSNTYVYIDEVDDLSGKVSSSDVDVEKIISILGNNIIKYK